MWPSSSLVLSSLALRFAAVHAQALATVTYGPSGPCPVPSVTSVVVVQAGYYSSFFQSASQIVNLFGNGETVTIQNAPTTYITNTYITTTIVSTVTSVVSPSTTLTTPSGGASVGPVTTSATPGSSLSTSISTASTATSSTPLPGTSTTSSTVFTPVSPPVTTPTPAPVLTSTSVDAQGNTILVPITQPPLVLGEGLPSGTVTDLPASSAVILGIAVGGIGGARVKRQDSGTEASDLLSGPDGGSSNACDVAQRYYLQNGQLTNGTYVVGRNTTDSSALMVVDPYLNNVTTVFAFANGILQWDSTDRGPAQFYRCGDDKVYAGFQSPPQDDCYNVTLGGIAASACPVPYRNADAIASSTTTSQSISTTTDVPTTTPEVTTTTTTTTDTESPTSATTTSESASSSDQTSTESSATSSPSSSSEPTVTSSLAQTTEPTVTSTTSDVSPGTTAPVSTSSTSAVPIGTSSSIKLNEPGTPTIQLDKYPPITVKLVGYCHYPVELQQCCSRAIQHDCCSRNDSGRDHNLWHFFKWKYRRGHKCTKLYIPGHSKYKSE
ncbi:uncharacterized protein Z520_01460 [Fonsecaea multimorphosa CBS 102226]|uniref:DUF7908 domain-containing protein n=1 Tax=Fonsecaea multimorphosa CBS 102226 TaxID=1442371 RepID=A0A0D2L1S0_9EURO|nr:uncharacterized protein Z520_01460 [Fonsecaea multimorphosa CBS 102226]KIY02994.1 hypothetical protein Z520_01460 [Fonsecaea multimorphosa CBS 102226]